MALCSLMALPAALAADIVVQDDTGREVHLEAPAQRIISLAPSMTELLFSIGAGDRIVGVMAYSNYPPQALEIPVVGRHDMLDLEGIIALQPDLIVAWETGNPRSAVQQLQRLGLSVYIAEPSSLESIAVQVERLAALTGLDEPGQAVAARFREKLAALAADVPQAEPVSVFYQVWHAPMISVGGNELINDIIELCGGRNIFRELNVGPKIGIEAVLQRNPEAIIASGANPERPQWLDDWRQWPALDAVKKDNLYFIPPDLVQRHSLRALEGAAILCTHLHSVRAKQQ